MSFKPSNYAPTKARGYDMESRQMADRRTSPFSHWPAAAQSVAVFFAFSAILTSFLALLYAHGFIDEADNFVGGMVLGRGLSMYRDFYSQHTPLVYHLMSWPFQLGVQSGPALRLVWFTIIASMIYGIYCLQKREFGAVPALVLLFGFAVGTEHYLAHVVLSDGVQALGLLMTFYVFARFRSLESMPAGHMLLLGLGAWSATMSAFLSVYPLFILALAFIWQQVGVTLSRPGRGSSPARYAMFAGLVMLPFVFSLLFYWQQGTLGDFYYQAYKFNRIHYANYGAGTDNILALFLKPTLVFALLQTALFNLTHGIYAPSVYLASGAALAAILGLAFGYRHRPAIALLSIYFVLMCGTRVVHSHFHALPIYAVCLGAAGFGLARLVQPNARQFLYLVSIIASTYIVVKNGPQALQNIAALRHHDPMAVTHHFIAEHTHDGDTIWQGVLDPYVYLTTKRLPASRMTDLVPWFWDAYKDDLLADLQRNLPKFVILNPDASLIGKTVSGYAPELMQFLKENYQRPPESLSPPEWVLVRKGAVLAPPSPTMAAQ